MARFRYFGVNLCKPLEIRGEDFRCSRNGRFQFEMGLSTQRRGERGDKRREDRFRRPDEWICGHNYRVAVEFNGPGYCLTVILSAAPPRVRIGF
jgi:hypothetical protein